MLPTYQSQVRHLKFPGQFQTLKRQTIDQNIYKKYIYIRIDTQKKYQRCSTGRTVRGGAISIKNLKFLFNILIDESRMC